MAEQRPPAGIDPRSGFCAATRTFHSLRQSATLPPDSLPATAAAYAFSLLSSPLPSPATVLSKKPASLLAVPSGTARRGVRVVAAAAAAAPPVSAASRARPSAAEVARTVVELAPSGTLSVVGPDGWPLGVGARFVADAAGAPALCLAAAAVAVPDAPSSFHVEVRGRSRRVLGLSSSP